VWERTQKLTISIIFTIMTCYARDSLSFDHLFDVWSYT